MQIHQLTIKKRKAKKTVGRGGKRGTYSGRGNKGQRARSGASIDPLFEGGRSSLVERLKKVRGFKSHSPKKAVVKLSQLEKTFQGGEEITVALLVQSKLVDKAEASNGVKILANGELKKKLTIANGLLLSETAKAAIIKAGGTIQE